MAGGTFGFDPLQALLMRVQQQPQNEEQYASGGAAPSSTPPSTAPTPAPVAGPSGGGGTGPEASAGGGISNLLASLSGAAGKALSGFSLVGDHPGDADIDPSSGAPFGMVRKANGQRMMNLGMMLLAAGGRQSDDSRARILASIPGQIGDPTSQLNEFAKTRLDMAKTKLIEQQMLQEQAASAAIGKWARGGQDAAAAPTTPGSVTPSAVAPVVAAAVPGAIGQQAASVSGAPGSISIPPRPAYTGGTPPAGQPAPPAGQLVPPAPMPFADAHPSTPPQTEVLSGRPPAPKPLQFGPQTMTDADRLYLETPTIKRDAKLEYIANRNKEFAGTELATPIYRDEKGLYKQDVYKNGQRIGEKFVKDAPSSIRDTPLPGGGGVLRETIAPDGTTVTHREEVYDPKTKAQTEKTEGLYATQVEKLKGNYDTVALPASRAVDKLSQMAENIKDGKIIAGFGANARQYLVNMSASLGLASTEDVERLVNTAQVKGQLDTAAGEFAKMYYGPQISEKDVDNAKVAIQAAISNAPPLLEAALRRMRDEAVNKVKDHDEKATKHNENIKGREPVWQVPTVGRNFDTPASGTPPASAVSTNKPPGPLKGRIVNGVFERL